MRRRLFPVLFSGGVAADTTAPTVEITSAASGTTAGAFDVTITTSEDTTDFVLGGITVSANAGAGSFAGSGTVYTATITPTAIGVVTVDVNAGAFHDAAGNANEAATQFSITNTTIAAPAITPTLGAELLVNPGFEGTYDTEAVGIDIAPDWNMSNLDTGTDTAAKELTTIHGGSASQKFACDAASEGVVSAANCFTSIGWYQIEYWSHKTATVRAFDANGDIQASPAGASGIWERAIGTGRLVVANSPIYIRTTAAGAATIYLDDASVKLITLASMLVSVGTRAGRDGTYICTPTVAAESQAGMAVAYLGATDFVLAVVNRALTTTTAKLLKYISGTWTQVITGSITYGATKQLKVVISGTSYSLYYDNVQVGTTQTIANTLGEGVYAFNALAGNTVGTVTVTA
jgi:hypothetical protein